MKLSQFKQIIQEEIRKVIKEYKDSEGFESIEGGYGVMYKGPSLSAVGTLIKMGEKGGVYKVGRTMDGRNSILMTNVKNSSDKVAFKDEAKMLAYLQDYVDPRGGTQSSQF